MPPNRTIDASQGRSQAPQRRLGAAEAQEAAPHFDQRQAGTRAEVKQPGKQQRVGDAEEQLCNRCARAKQECGPERQQRTIIKVAVMRLVAHSLVIHMLRDRADAARAASRPAFV